MLLKLQSALARCKPEWALGVAASLSLALILFPKNRLSTSYQFIPPEHKARLLNDAYSGGNSTTRWLDEQRGRWRCSLGQAYTNPYCSLRLDTTDKQGKGLDLSRALSLKIWLNYHGDGKHLRLYLQNRSAKYYVAEDELSAKYNMVEIPVADLAQGLTIQLSDFNVADWWVSQRNIPLKDAKPEFNDIYALEIQTGSAVKSGDHEIQLERLEWQIPWFSELQLYRNLTIFWTLLIVGYLSSRLINMQFSLKKQQRYQDELLTINNLLSLQNRQFEDLAKTDALTGLLNRLGIREVLYRGLRDWKKNETPFSIMLIDLDHFKRINDTLGHDVGDEVLKAVAERLTLNVRKSDFVARWGGEEFILLCPATNRVETLAAAECLRQKLSAAPIYSEVAITASFGISCLTQPDLDHLFKCADEALYRAKNHGRNCVMSDVRLSA